MAYSIDDIRSHAFKVVQNFDDFEAGMIAFGESLPAAVSPAAHDPRYTALCNGAAVWVWKRENMIAASSARSARQRGQDNTSRRDHVLKLRNHGMTYQQIATETGWT